MRRVIGGGDGGGRVCLLDVGGGGSVGVGVDGGVDVLHLGA